MTEIATDASQEGIHIAYFILFCTPGYQLKCTQSSESVFQLFTSFGRPHNFVNIKTLCFVCLQAYVAYPVINEFDKRIRLLFDLDQCVVDTFRAVLISYSYLC